MSRRLYAAKRPPAGVSWRSGRVQGSWELCAPLVFSCDAMTRHATVSSHRSLAAIMFLAVHLGSAVAAAQSTSAADPATMAQTYLDEWTSKGEAACVANAPECTRLGESLYNAAAAFQAAGERNKAIMARSQLIQPKYHLDQTEIGKKALFQLAEDHKALAEYARAAELFETAVARFSTAAEAPDALMDATLFRLTLGEMESAKKNAVLYDKLFDAKKPASAVAVWLGIAGTLTDGKQFHEAKAVLSQQMARIDKDGEIRDKFLAHAWLGRTLAGLDDAQGAEKEYQTVRAMWQRTEAQKQVMAEVETNPRNVGKVLTVVGEALFFFAEKKRKDVEAIRFPAYQGSADKDDVIRHLNTKVVDWIKKKRPAIEEAESAYRLILELPPAPPPRWVVASASRVGNMWAKFVAEFRAAPIPKVWTQNGPIPGAPDVTFEELRKDYYARIDEAAEPEKQRAKAAFKVCVGSSAKYQYNDEYSRTCLTWLEKNYPKEFVPVGEFIPATRLFAAMSGAAEPLPDPRSSK